MVAYLTRPGSELEVANLALGKCKEDEIATFDDDLNRARVVRRHFGLVRDALLARLDWNFASTWAAPAADATQGVGTFVDRYPLPADCIVIRQVFDGNVDNVLDDDSWAVESGYVASAGVQVEAKILVTNSTSALIRYTRRVESPRVWDPLFMTAYVCLLAAACAPELGRSTTQAEKFTGEAESLLIPVAKRVDSAEIAPTKVGGEKLTSWLAARAPGSRIRRFWW